MYTEVGVYYAPGLVLQGELFDEAEAVCQIENFQPQYAVPELTEKNFWRMFDAGLYEHCRREVLGVIFLVEPKVDKKSTPMPKFLVRQYHRRAAFLVQILILLGHPSSRKTIPTTFKAVRTLLEG
ncbi:delta(24)-sterol reductase [Olea europaea subsp. europaea]|uniref:Delta(24)-sterol reductase n=1 Tax=Olea europaea subsp. europaea TaxID=158383 RepID=A0A8S0R065_OLEEU|nr:delta(24)-sterol reductase [Olea europaea subsp. europaea]